MKYWIGYLWLLLLFVIPVIGQTDQSLHFSISAQRLNDTSVTITIDVQIKSGIRLYSSKQQGDMPVTMLFYDSSLLIKSRGETTETGNLQQQYDSLLQGPVRFATDSIRWQNVLRITEGASSMIKVKVGYTYSKVDEYITGEELLKIKIPEIRSVKNEHDFAGSLISVFLLSFAGGLLALITPCVYSMIPVTVSFFTKRSPTVKEARKNALYYASSIVFIFTGLGFLVTWIFGPAVLNTLATNWIANLFFFVLFLLFGFSFLGAFEISLPSKWSTKADAHSAIGSFSGIFFMALTLVLVSFSCTGPIIGNLLVLASKGNYFGPLTGMFGFSMALALPFAFFAFFPGKLNLLGKSGGWLNSVKVVLGFLELALALKFLSNADLVKGWRLLDREVFIVLWVVIFFLMGIYLLGKIRFHHDGELKKNDFGVTYIGVPRLTIAIIAFSFSLYLIPGLWGAPLKAVSSFLPPMGTQDFNASLMPSTVTKESRPNTAMRKYEENMSIYEPEVVTKYGLQTFYEYKEALQFAKEQNKPLMLDFTGINCVNCRKMEGQVWSDPAIMQRLKNDFVIASLYVDAHHITIPADEQFYSEVLGKEVETMGDVNAHLQVTMFATNSQPNYFFINAEEKLLYPKGYGYDPDIQKFKKHLDTVIELYHQQQKEK